MPINKREAKDNSKNQFKCLHYILYSPRIEDVALIAGLLPL